MFDGIKGSLFTHYESGCEKSYALLTSMPGRKPPTVVLHLPRSFTWSNVLICLNPEKTETVVDDRLLDPDSQGLRSQRRNQVTLPFYQTTRTLLNTLEVVLPVE